MSRLVVIGSNSFSGASFIKFGLKQKANIVGLSRSEEPSPSLLPYKWDDHQNFSFYQFDLNQNLKEIMQLIDDYKPNFVVNFAAQSMVAESWKNPRDWFMTNVVSSVEFQDELRKRSFLERYVHVSTPEVYGSCSGFVDENFPFNPSTPYAVSRAACDMSLNSFYHAYQFPVVSTRAANVYGPGQQLYRIIPRTILSILMGKKLQLHGGGISTRSFIHMDDVSEATWQIMQKGENGNTYHISTNEVISIRDLVARICEKLGVDFDDHVDIVGERLGKDSAYHLDSTKLRNKFNWQDKISLDQGLDDCIAWAKHHLETLKTLPIDYIHKQ